MAVPRDHGRSPSPDLSPYFSRDSEEKRRDSNDNLDGPSQAESEGLLIESRASSSTNPFWRTSMRLISYGRLRLLLVGLATVVVLAIAASIFKSHSTRTTTAVPSVPSVPSQPAVTADPFAPKNSGVPASLKDHPASESESDSSTLPFDSSSTSLRPVESDRLHEADLVKPKGVKVIALIFYGRPDRVKILECYLRRNLVENGGQLDEVHWVANTEDQDKLKYLDEHIVPLSPKYIKVSLNKTGYDEIWEHTVEKDNMYIKIDDDVVWIDDSTIAELVHTKIEYADKFFVVSANMINSPLMGWVHYHTRAAIHPYLPELEAPTGPKNPTNWRASSQPKWKGPDNYRCKPDADVPFKGHRWLRLDDDDDFTRTPISGIEYGPFGTGWKSWAIAAQEHASLLENIEKKQVDLYRTQSRIWNTHSERLSINFIALWGNEILEQMPVPDGVDDEEYFTQRVPEKIHKATGVNTRALAAHFSFNTQHNLDETDLLARYQSYADEFICKT
ncbi:MAG: hypothetical protein M1825_000541 [Sarcosagium campestre]|nr:MAG: hypothetical protein M1825_000541 [Sarcosagium campestre]